MDSSYFTPGISITFDSAITIRETFCQALKKEQKDAFCINLDNVIHCDSAGLALLIEMKKLCEQYDKHFKIIGLPGKIQALAEFYGVNHILEKV